ncbi:tandem-95 repeat protein, partial [Anabaena sp. 4-3]|uniref:tandem-95 repeat protein n=1 Tax=Anabaena sp. 4-3 TaxID=1811979 RepID=UPI000A55BB97
VTYTPNPNFNGTDNFTYTVKDNQGAISQPATVTVTVNPVNDEPVAKHDTITTNEDTNIIIPILENDEDVDGNDTINPNSVVIETQPSNGNVTINNDGTVTYTPNPNFNGTDNFTYTVKDN